MKNLIFIVCLGIYGLKVNCGQNFFVLLYGDIRDLFGNPAVIEVARERLFKYSSEFKSTLLSVPLDDKKILTFGYWGISDKNGLIFSCNMKPKELLSTGASTKLTRNGRVKLSFDLGFLRDWQRYKFGFRILDIFDKDRDLGIGGLYKFTERLTLIGNMQKTSNLIMRYDITPRQSLYFGYDLRDGIYTSLQLNFTDYFLFDVSYFDNGWAVSVVVVE